VVFTTRERGDSRSKRRGEESRANCIVKGSSAQMNFRKLRGGEEKITRVGLRLEAPANEKLAEAESPFKPEKKKNTGRQLLGTMKKNRQSNWLMGCPLTEVEKP